MLVHQDADLYVARLAPGTQVSHPFRRARLGWMQIARGSVELDGQLLEQGDGAALGDLSELTIKARDAAEVLLFDMVP